MNNENLILILELCEKELLNVKADLENQLAIANAGIEPSRLTFAKLAHRSAILKGFVKHIVVYFEMEKETENWKD